MGLGLDWLDMVINVLALAIVPGIIAAYGGHLAAEAIGDRRRGRKVKAFFWILFLVGVLVTFWQQFRIAESDLARETKDTWQQALITKLLFFPPLPPPPTVVGKLVPRPDIGMEFVNPGDVAFRMVNLSKDVVLRDPKYTFVLVDIDGPRTVLKDGTSLPYILPIPAFSDSGDFLKGGQKFIPRPIVSTFPAVQSIVKPNDRIVGTATVSCPDCIRDRRYLVFFVNGSGGWYCEIEKDIPIGMRELLTDAEGTLLKAVPSERRIRIDSAK
ncbi:MAG: hypothetical protein LAN36_13990 [Acidobacteriia bacterium]|nr:hypothetical protein [Terriglobia bacterium]